MKYFTLTPGQKKDIRDGKTVILTAKDDGKQYIITPYIIHHAEEQLAGGATEIMVLPEVVGDGMEELRLSLLMPVINSADFLRVGNVAVDKAFMGTTQVWPPAGMDFYPDMLSGLAQWYAADYTEWSEGQSVNVWYDLSGNGRDLSLVGSPSPKFHMKAGDDRPIVRYKASEGRHRHASTGVNLEWTLVYVARLTGPTPGRVIDGTYPPNNILVGFWNGYQDVMYDNGFTSPNTQTAWTTDWKLYSGDGTSGLSRLFADGVFMGSTTTSAGWGGTFNISGYGSTGVEETCDCEVAEVVMYNRKLSDAERGQVEEYLRVKWGL